MWGEGEGHYPQPFWTFGTEAEALETEADAGRAAALGIHLLVALLGEDEDGKGRWRERRPCDGFCRCNSRTWRVPRLLFSAFRVSSGEVTLGRAA